MNYIELLNEDEKALLCEIITGKLFKELFKQKERAFSKIQKGFRAKSLPDSLALSIAIKNIDEPFISIFINKVVEDWIKDINLKIENLETHGSTYDLALATALLDSVFAEHVDIYLKLTEKPSDEDACSKLVKDIEYIKNEQAKQTEVADKIKSLEEENKSLSAQIQATNKNTDSIKADYEKKLKDIEREKLELEQAIAEAKTKITQLQAAPTAIETDNLNYLSEYDDTNSSLLPTADDKNIFSLCRVTASDYYGQKWLIRYADLNNDGTFHIFHKDETLPSQFTNRDKIFYKNGPSSDDFYGIWSWYATPNTNDPSKDYIFSNYYEEISPIEVIRIEDITNIDKLISLLKTGLECLTHSNKTMFAILSATGQYTGILCDNKNLTIDNEKALFTKDCNEICLYEFNENDIIQLDNGLCFLKTAFAGIPNRIYYLKSPLDIVKDIVMSSISWTTYKARGVIKADYTNFKDFLGAIPVDDITHKIETACHCSYPAAKTLLDNFLNVVGEYMDGNILEDKIILSAISSNSELQKRTKELIREDWETENKTMLDEAQKNLQLLNSELTAKEAALAKATQALNDTKLEEKRLADILSEKETLANDVEKKVAERIRQAQDNVADFIASMSFIGSQRNQNENTPSATTTPYLHESISNYIIFPEAKNRDELEPTHCWSDAINVVADELSEAGVMEQYRGCLAAYLCAAYIERQPILLVGPNAIDIVKAFSAAITAHKCGLLCCEGNYDNQTVSKIGNDGEDIVIITNLFTSSWMNRLPEILLQKDVFFISVHPYAEDIQVEPKSLYSFMLPLFTEFFVDRKASGKYYGGYFADDFEKYSEQYGSQKNLKTLSQFALSTLVSNNINKLVNIMHKIYPSINSDDEFLFAVLPIAYATMSMNKLNSIVSEPQKGITISAKLKRELEYLLGDING